MESWVQSWQPRTNAFCDFFQSTCRKYCAYPRKSDARSYEVLHLSRKIISANLKIWGSKMNPSQEIRDLLTSLVNMSLAMYCHGKFIFADPLQMSNACHRFWKFYKTLTVCSLLTRCTLPCACHAKQHLIWCFWTFWLRNVLRATTACTFSTAQLPKWSRAGVFCTFWFRNVLRATTVCTFSTSQLPKVVRTWCALCIVTSKCASRHNGVHFFDGSTSKSGRRMVCFVHLESFWYILTSKRALRHNGVHFFDSSTSRSGPELVCFVHSCTFWLRHVLRATTACKFSSLICPAGSAPAALASLLFDPPGATNHWKNPTVFRDFPTFFSHLHLLSSYSFSSTLLSSDLFLLSASALLCFSSVHIVGSLTSKLSCEHSDGK